MKRSLVVSGGGSKGAYAVGVLDQFNQTNPKLKFDSFVGTSTGALIAPFMALGKLDTLIDIYTDTETKDVLVQKKNPPTFNQSSIYSTSPLRKLIDDNLSDEECNSLLRSRSKSIYLMTVCLQTKKLTVFTNRGNLPTNKSKVYDVVKLKDAEHLKRAMLGSANQPVFMPMIKVNKLALSGDLKERQYGDGGVVEYAGVEIAIDANADEIFTIFLSPVNNKVDKTNYGSIMKIAGRTLGTLTGNVGVIDLRIPNIQNNHLKYIEQVKLNLIQKGVSPQDIDSAFKVTIPGSEFSNRPPINMHLIRPSQELKAGAQGLEFNKKEMKAMMALGRVDATTFLNGLSPHQMTWRPAS